MMEHEETWKPVTGWEGLYEVSDLGRVRSLPRDAGKRRLRVRGKILTPQRRKRGHLMVVLSSGRTTGGRCEQHFIHRLVLAAFVGPRPDGAISRHLDGDPSNNRPDNLAWGTHQENSADALRHGTTARGQKIRNALLTEELVLELRKAADSGEPVKVLAKRFGIAYRTANHIVTGVKWQYVGGPIQPRRERWYLNDDQVRQIRALTDAGRSLSSVGKEFSLPPNSIKAIRDRKYYTWVA